MADEQQLVKGPDGKDYRFPKGTTKEQAIGYFKKKGIAVAPPPVDESKQKATSTPLLDLMHDTAVGAGKSLGQPVAAVSNLLNKIPGVGEYLAPKQGVGALKQITTLSTDKPGEVVGMAAEQIAEFALGEGIVTKGMSAVAALPRLRAMVGSTRAAKVLAAMMKMGAIGTAQSAAHGEEHPIQSGLVTAGTAGVAEYLSPKIAKAGSKALPKAWAKINSYIGLSTSDMPKWERLSPGKAEEIGKTVMEQGALRGTLEETYAATEAAREKINGQTEKLVNTAIAKQVPVHSILKGIGKNLEKEIITSGQDVAGTATKALDANLQEFTGITKPNMSTKEALELRRKIQKEIKWNQIADTMNVRQRFLGELYSSLNDGIERALNPQDASEFSRLNKTQSRLIIARDAAGERLAKEEMKQITGLSERAAKMLIGGTVGAISGGAAGSEFGHAKEGAISGAVLGTAAGSIAKTNVNLPRATVAEKQAISKLAPRIAELAKKSPYLARLLEVVTSGQSGSVAARQ